MIIKIFCTHGGLSKELNYLDDIRKSNRVQEVPDSGLICDLLWSDPDDKDGISISPRGAGSIFGPNITKTFCHDNKLDLILRAHQLVMDGFSTTHEDTVYTLFSAPNYCYRCGNKASIMELDQNCQKHIQQFDPASEGHNEEVIKQKTVPNYFL